MTGLGPTNAGSVTAETAVALPALLVVLAGALSVLAAVSAQLRCVDVARLAARAAARGDADAEVLRQAVDAAPGARLQVQRADGLVRVRVTLGVGPRAVLPLAVSAEAAAGDETLPVTPSAPADESGP